MTENGLQPPEQSAPEKKQSTSRWRRWIIPQPIGKGWRAKLRWITFRLGFWYLVIVLAIVFFQRKLIYHPTQSDRLLAAESRLPKGNVHDVSIETTDGLILNGWHFLPKGKICKDQKACDRALAQAEWVVLYFHGNSGNRKRRDLDCRPFTGHGGHVFLFDYRGYGDNPGSPSESSLMSDARQLWKYVTEEREVPASRILIFGESLGGGVATGLSAELCEAGTPPGGLILRATFSSLGDVGSHRYPWLPVRWCLIDRFPSVEHIPMVTCPILQIHGERDRIVPIKFARKLFTAAPDQSVSGVSKKFAALRFSGHNDIPVSSFHQFVGEYLVTIRNSFASK
jgi:uncharacterized protein